MSARITGPLLLLLLTLGFYWKLAFTGQYIWFDHPDMCYIELPRVQFQVREIQHGRFPLWDPYIWCGQSLIGQTQPGPLFPLNLAFALLPLRDDYLRVEHLNWYYVVFHFLAALFCYFLCRELRAGTLASVLAACAFSFGGFMGTVPWLDVMNGALLSPLVLLFILRAARGYKPLASAALAGMFLGIAWLSGHHEIPLLLTCLAGLSWLFFTVRDWRLLRPALLSFFIAALVSAVQLWPTYEFGRLSKRWVGVEQPVEWNDRVPYNIHTIYSLTAKGVAATVVPGRNDYGDTSPFLGATVVALATLGIAAGWRDRRVRFLGLLVVVSLLYSMGALTPLHGILYSASSALAKARLPVRAIHFYNLGICLLAALGAQALHDRAVPAWTRRISIALALAGAAFLAAAWVLPDGTSGLDRIWLAGLAALVAAAVLATPLREKLGALAILILIELTALSTAPLPHIFEGNQVKFAGALHRNRDIAAFLRAQDRPARVSVDDRDVPDNFGDWHSIEMLQGYVAGVPANLTRQGLHTDRIRRLFGVHYHIGKNPSQPDQVEMFTGASGVKVFRNPDPMPRVWAVHEAVQAKTFVELDALQQNPALDFHKTAGVLDGQPRLEQCAGLDEIKLLRHNTDRVTVSAKMACRGMLIVADSYYPGWRVMIDGKPSTVQEVYGALRGVEVEAGSHVIDMIYRPWSILGGALLTLAGFLLTAALTIPGTET